MPPVMLEQIQRPGSQSTTAFPPVMYSNADIVVDLRPLHVLEDGTAVLVVENAVLGEEVREALQRDGRGSRREG